MNSLYSLLNNPFPLKKKKHFTSITAVSYKIISVEIKYPSKLHILPSSQFDIICHGWSNNILILNISANSQMTYLRFHAVQSILQVSCIFAESQNKHNHKSNKIYTKKNFHHNNLLRVNQNVYGWNQLSTFLGF